MHLSQTKSAPLTGDNLPDLFWAFIYFLCIYIFDILEHLLNCEIDWEDLSEASAKVGEWRDSFLCSPPAVLANIVVHLSTSDSSELKQPIKWNVSLLITAFFRGLYIVV